MLHKPELSAAEGSAPCEQVYTGYFWFCVMYFFLALVVTQIMMRFPPLGQPRSNWVSWAKVGAFSGSVLPMNATVKAVVCPWQDQLQMHHEGLNFPEECSEQASTLQDRTWLSLIGFTAGVVVSVANVLQFLGGEAAGKQLTPCTTPSAQLLIIIELGQRTQCAAVHRWDGNRQERQRPFGGPCRIFCCRRQAPIAVWLSLHVFLCLGLGSTMHGLCTLCVSNELDPAQGCQF